MTTAICLIVVAVALSGLYLVFRPSAQAYLKFRGTRVITCPETKEPAAVEVDASHAALTAALGTPGLRLADCSRWPGRQGCGQECLKQVEAAPADCLVRTILTKWYAGKPCAMCGHPVEKINWSLHKPALINAERRTFEWQDVPPEKLPQVLSTHQPVCWNCHIAETFRNQYPDLVVVRPWKH